MDVHADFVAVSGQSLVYRVIDDLEHAMVQAAFMRVANVHVGPLSNPFQSLQLLNLGGIVVAP